MKILKVDVDAELNSTKTTTKLKSTTKTKQTIRIYNNFTNYNPPNFKHSTINIRFAVVPAINK